MAAIEIKGVDELVKKLGKVGAVETLMRPMTDSQADIHQMAARYPEPIVDSPYIRTDTLKRGWIAPKPKRIGGGGLQGKVGTNVEYAPWVVSEQFQAGIHRGRWRTDAGIIDKLKPSIVKRFQDAIDRALR